jgi:hypothetical protein
MSGGRTDEDARRTGRRLIVALVIDASVGLKWALEEPDSHLAEALVRAEPDLLVPDFWLHEATNVLEAGDDAGRDEDEAPLLIEPLFAEPPARRRRQVVPARQARRRKDLIREAVGIVIWI